MTYYGIYKITNLINGKMYIGQHMTDDLDDGYMGGGTIIKRAIRKYGKENFRKEWIMFCEDWEEMDYMERVLVDETWISRSDTYNVILGGQGRKGGWSEEMKQRISNKKKGRTPWNKGKTGIYTDETRRQISNSLKGKNHPNFGKALSDETKRKIGDANRGRKPSEEARRKMSMAKKGKPTWNKGLKQTR